MREAGEERLAGSERDGVHDYLERVYESRTGKLRYDAAAAKDRHVRTGFVLHPANRPHDVVLHQGRVAPVSRTHRTREDDLGHRVHPRCDLGHGVRGHRSWPPCGHHVVCRAAEEQHTSAARVPGHELVPLRVAGRLVSKAHVSVWFAVVAVEADLHERSERSRLGLGHTSGHSFLSG